MGYLRRLPRKNLIRCPGLVDHYKRVLLEATGGYERAVFKALRLEGLNVVRVNPRRCRDYASAMGKIAKTDKIDAQMLARFARDFEDLPQIEPNQDRDELGEPHQTPWQSCPASG
ncbi:IS110 family transposase [Pseudomonas putida]|uniref:IS110 family transposase n=1 Tax=Pseudomonas putida TaxID=303 RepID=UPI001EE66FF8|nr:transposase [Pseudomonas putida]